jgi:hypothetical protein
MSRGRLRSAKATLRLPRVSERAEQSHIVQLLRTVGGQVYVLGTTRRRGDYAGTMQTPGLPDLLAFLPVKRSLETDGAAALERDPICAACGHVMNGQGGMCRALDGACRCVCVARSSRVVLCVEVCASSRSSTIGDDAILRERLALSCAGIAHPVIAVFEVVGRRTCSMAARN